MNFCSKSRSLRFATETVSEASSWKLMRAVPGGDVLFLTAERRMNVEAMYPSMVLEAVDGDSTGVLTLSDVDANSVSAEDSGNASSAFAGGVGTLSDEDANSVSAEDSSSTSCPFAGGVGTLFDEDANSVSAEDSSNASCPFAAIIFVAHLKPYL